MLASTGFTISDLQNLTSDAQNLTKEERITFTEEKIQEITAMQNDLESAKELLSKMVAESKKKRLRPLIFLKKRGTKHKNDSCFAPRFNF